MDKQNQSSKAKDSSRLAPQMEDEEGLRANQIHDAPSTGGGSGGDPVAFGRVAGQLEQVVESERAN